MKSEKNVRIGAIRLVVALGIIGACSPAAAADPVGLVVRPATLEAPAGRELAVSIALRDAEGGEARAPKRLDVRVTADGAGLQRSLELVFEPRALDRKLTLTPDQPGLLEIRAQSSELREGGAFVRIAEAPPETVRSAPMRRKRIPRLAPPVPRLEPRAGDADRNEALRERQRSPALPPLEAAPVAPRPSNGGPRSGQRVFDLILRASPDRGLLANGRDPSTIYAFLRDGQAGPSGLRIHLVPDSGALTPTPLKIPAGQGAGQARLTASSAGTVRVEFVSAEPPATLEGNDVLEVAFQPPITGLRVSGSSDVALGETLPIAAYLVGSGGDTVATDQPRIVSFAMTSGHGRIEQADVEIPPGRFKAESRFVAEGWKAGRVDIAVASPGLLTEAMVVDVQWPWLLLSVIVASSLAGGFIAWTHGPARRRHLARRLFTGVVGGLVLYSLLRFVTPRDWVANPFGAFLIAVLGGWLGTQAFDIAVRTVFGERKASSSAP